MCFARKKRLRRGDVPNGLKFIFLERKLNVCYKKNKCKKIIDFFLGARRRQSLMNDPQRTRSDLLSTEDHAAVFEEIRYVISLMDPMYDFLTFASVQADVIRLFQGDFPGYRACNTRYHDLEHTMAVTLAVVRLLHGAFVRGISFSSHELTLGVICAFFHDAGLIQTENDLEGSGAKYTANHEERSIDFMRGYFAAKNFSRQDLDDCAAIITSTKLSVVPADIEFRNESIRMLGNILGSADLLAQMADRKYLEKLLLLFQEFNEAGLPGFNSELELLRKTEDFYERVVQKRLCHDFNDIGRYMRDHFRTRWQIDTDLYRESVQRNIQYLQTVIAECKDHRQCGQYLETLRRNHMSGKSNCR